MTNNHKSQFNKCVQALFKGGEKGGFSNGEVVDYMGVQSRPVQLGRAYNFDGIDDAIFRNMIGVTIVSWQGTAVLTVGVGNDRINATAGTVWDIRLSDGTLYKCDEGGGSLAIDSSGNNLDGTITNANLTTFHTTLINGQGADWQNKFGYTPAIGVQEDQNITIVDNTNIGIGQNFAVDFFAVLTGSTGSRGFCEKYNGVDNNYFQIYTNGSGRVVVSFVVGGVTQCSLTSSTALSTDTPYHIEYVRTNGLEHRLFIEGTIEASNLAGGSLNYNLNRDWHFGRLPSNAPNFDMNGWIRLPRLANISRHTANFTPPTVFTDYNLNETGLIFLAENHNSIIFNRFGNTVTNTNTQPQYVPRNENNINFDAFGEPLFYRGRVKYNAQLRQSNCLTFDGANDNVLLPNPTIGTSDYIAEIYFRGTALGGNQNLFYFGNGTFTRMRLRSGAGNILQATINGFNTPDLIQIVANQIYKVTLIKTGNNAFILLNDIEIYRTIGNITNSLTVTNHRLGSNNNGGNDYFAGQLFGYKLDVAGVPYCDFPMQEGGGNRVFSRVGGHVGTMNNFNLINVWANRQDLVHSNLINGFEEYTDGGSGLIRVPLSSTGASLGAVIAGYSSQGIRRAGTWHNNAETLFRNYQAPALLSNDVSNTYFTAGVANNVAFNVAETTRLKHIRPNNDLGNIRLYSLNTGEK